MKKRCEKTLVILELSIHEFVSLFSWKRVDELKTNSEPFKRGSKVELKCSLERERFTASPKQ